MMIEPPGRPSASASWDQSTGKWVEGGGNSGFGVQDLLKLIGYGGSAYLGAQGSQDQTSTATQTPYFRPFQEGLANDAQDIYSQGLPQYTGQTWAGPTANQQAGWDAAAGWAGGTPASQALGSMAYTLQQGAPHNTTAQQTGPAAQTQLSQAGPAAQWNAQQTGPAAQATTQQAQQQWADNPYIWANSPQASNQYIGQTSKGIAGVGNAADSIRGDLGPAAQAGVSTASSAFNPLFGMNNPYTQQAIDFASKDINRQFSQNVMPQLDRLMQQSGSFGNTGVQQMQTNAMDEYTRNVGGIANQMRMQDLGAQQQMGESQAGRETGINTFNAGAQNTANLTNANAQNTYGLGRAGLLGNLTQGDLARALGTQEFNANLGSGDLSRNAQLMQNMSQFNVGNQVGDVRQGQNLAQQQHMFNAGQGNSLNQFNAGQANDTSRFNANATNQNNQFNTGQANTVGMYNIGQTNSNNQFATNQANTVGMYNTGQTNSNNQFNVSQGNAVGMDNTAANNAAYRDAANIYAGQDTRALNAANTLMTVGGQQQGQVQAGLNNGFQNFMNPYINPDMAPYQNMNWYGNTINQLNGGQSTSTAMPGNPWMGAISGMSMFGAAAPYLFGQQPPNQNVPSGGTGSGWGW